MSGDAISIDALSADVADADGVNLFSVELPGYEGPLHLLLELARRQKVNLLQISMLQLAEQYMGFIEDARAKRIDLAADYLLMASWLAFMKSRLLLPKPEALDEDEPTGEEMAARLSYRLKRLEAMRQAQSRRRDVALDLAAHHLIRVAAQKGKMRQCFKTARYIRAAWHRQNIGIIDQRMRNRRAGAGATGRADRDIKLAPGDLSLQGMAGTRHQPKGALCHRLG